MNEKLEKGKSLSEAGVTDPAQVIRIVAGRMLDTRPREPVRLRPYLQQPIRQKSSFGPYEGDFAACWPDAKQGSAAYAAARFYASRDQDVMLTAGGVRKLWLNHELLLSCPEEIERPVAREGAGPDDSIRIPVRMRKGWNELLLTSVQDLAGWGFKLTIAFPRYPGMWAKDYLFATRPTFPQKELQGEEGFAYIGPFDPGAQSLSEASLLDRLEFANLPEADGVDESACEAVWQPVVSAQPPSGLTDLCELYGEAAACAYALTCYDAGKAGLLLSLRWTGAVVVWIGGREVYRSIDGGVQAIPIPPGTAEGQVLVKCVRTAADWSLGAEVIDTCTGRRAEILPMLDTGRGDGAHWLHIGPFGDREPDPDPLLLLDQCFAVEKEIRFDRPYPSGEPGRSVYWRLSAPGTLVRPYRDGFFFGQWFYAIQVGLYGLLKAAETIGEAELRQYALDSTSALGQYHDYALWDAKEYGVPSLLPRAERLEELDPCGAAGVMLLECYERTRDPVLPPVIGRLADTVMKVVPRMEDGTFYRIETLWADDFFMSCPFLIRMGRFTGEERYYTEVIRQAGGFHSRLWMPDKRLYAHIYFPSQGVNSGVPWGRGNGWVMLALTEILLYLPEEHPERELMLAMLRNLAAGIAAYQADSGLWHQVLDERDSYEETSCTAMFVAAIARGIRLGWLDAALLASVRRGWEGLLSACLDSEGNVYGVCLGSGCSMEAAYYEDIPTYINDDHGTGIVLLAASEMLQLAEWSIPGVHEHGGVNHETV
ncbi:glycoside hydrolase family 88 protein [Paenibacillus filicis]|uniref:Glycoside hydrolase family 88 protein n=1 Tax=Paenibacillus filicis TaxID=669464 RepID=A0ABU9DSL2_9BACL